MSRVGDWIQTFTGRQFWPMDPRPDEIEIVDIAHALGMLCRYSGHCRRFYSVAEHSVLLASAVRPEHAFWALLHDATEAYLVDVPRPVKPFLHGYGDAEDRLMAAICVRFGLGDIMPSEVKAADRSILMDERLQNMAVAPVRWTTDGTPLGVKLEFWSPDEAERQFLATFARLARTPGEPS